MRWLFLLCSLLALDARADIPQPPPASCPRGAIGVGTSSASYCQPTTCASCPADRRCSPEPIGLCVVAQIVPNRVLPGILGDPGSTRIEMAAGPCRADGSCENAAAECRRERRCLLPDDPAMQSHGGCAIAPGSGGAFAALALVAIAASRSVPRRRAARRRSARDRFPPR